jgi:phosphatidylserine/phosphatidylglycerophosphate/cardiolipin synthase-like enzyme
MQSTADLSRVSQSALKRLRDAIAAGRIVPPIDRAALLGFGIRNQLEALEQALSGHKRAACVSILDAVLSERAVTKPTPELVWTGPEGASATARDTAVVLRSLFENAQTNVILAGFSFDHAKEVLVPLHNAMKERGITAIFIVHIDQAETVFEPPEQYAETKLADFIEKNWPFGPPYPRIYYDKRALTPGPPYCSMHAKCVAVDGRSAFISSANFTQRGQERNIEAGVLIEDSEFAEHLSMQWLGLIESGAVVEWCRVAEGKEYKK